METGLNAFKEALHLKHVEAGEYSPLALAYIGDAVYELAIRTLVMNRGNMQVNKMHKKTANLVKADAQARFYLLLEEELTDAEKAAYRRGRNAKSFTMPKGYLYLTEQFDRMAELLGKGLEQMGELAEAEGTSTDSHALQEAENEK